MKIYRVTLLFALLLSASIENNLSAAIGDNLANVRNNLANVRNNLANAAWGRNEYAGFAAGTILYGTIAKKLQDRRQVGKKLNAEKAKEKGKLLLKQYPDTIQDGVLRRMLMRFGIMSSFGDWYGLQDYMAPWMEFARDNGNISEEARTQFKTFAEKVDKGIDNTWTNLVDGWFGNANPKIADALATPEQVAMLEEFTNTSNDINNMETGTEPETSSNEETDIGPETSSNEETDIEETEIAG